MKGKYRGKLWFIKFWENPEFSPKIVPTRFPLNARHVMAPNIVVWLIWKKQPCSVKNTKTKIKMEKGNKSGLGEKYSSALGEKKCCNWISRPQMKIKKSFRTPPKTTENDFLLFKKSRLSFPHISFASISSPCKNVPEKHMGGLVTLGSWKPSCKTGMIPFKIEQS